MGYIGKLSDRINAVSNHIVVGLDPEEEKIPVIFNRFRNPVFEFLNRIIHLTKDTVCGYKFNLAFFEYYGEEGQEALNLLMKNIPEGLIKIADAKRGDIGNSSRMYAKTYFEKMDFDAVTVSPYMGTESIKPFLTDSEKFVYVLALTSNKDAEMLQMLKTEKGFLYEEVVRLFQSEFNEQVGFVFGANHTKEIKMITKKYTNLPLLIPGIGAQGGDKKRLENSLANNLYLINSSRGIIYSAGKDSSEEEFESKITESLQRLLL